MNKLGIKELAHIKVHQHRVAAASGSVAEFSGDCIVNAANTEGLEGGGIDGVLNDLGGDAFTEAREALPIINDDIRIPEGEARMTIGGNLKARWVAHAVGPAFETRDDKAEDAKLIEAYASSLELAAKRRCKTVGFSLISCGAFRGPRSLESVLEIGWNAIVSWCQEDGEEMSPMEIYMVGFRPEEQEILLKCALAAHGSTRVLSGGCCGKKKEFRQQSMRESSAARNPDIDEVSPPKDQPADDSGIFMIPEDEATKEDKKKKKKKKKKREDGEDTHHSSGSHREEQATDDIDHEMADLASPAGSKGDKKRESTTSWQSTARDADSKHPSSLGGRDQKRRTEKSIKSSDTQGDDAKSKGGEKSKGRSTKGSGRSKSERREKSEKGDGKSRKRGEKGGGENKGKGGEGKAERQKGKGKGKGKRDREKKNADETASTTSAA